MQKRIANSVTLTPSASAFIRNPGPAALSVIVAILSNGFRII